MTVILFCLSWFALAVIVGLMVGKIISWGEQYA